MRRRSAPGVASASAPKTMSVMRGLVSVFPPATGAGKAAVHDRAGRCDDRERPVAALVARDGRVGEVEEGVVDRRGGHGVDRVHGPDRLRCGAGEVGDHLAAADREQQLDRIVVVGDPVVLDRVFEQVLPVGDLLDLGPHPPLGDRLQLRGRLLQEVAPLLADQGVQARLGELRDPIIARKSPR